MGASTSDHLTSHDLEMIDISWKFVDKKHDLGLNTMIRYNKTTCFSSIHIKSKNIFFYFLK